MTRWRLINAYFDWLYDIVSKDDPFCKLASFRDLLWYLNSVQFTYTIPMDGNRAEDGMNLRYRFGDEQGYDQAMIASHLDDRPCSVLEMMIAFAVRCEEQVMADYEIGDRTAQWFWDMVESLGLGQMSDDYFDEDEADFIVDRFLNREYERNGKGGLFTIRHDSKNRDMRTLEIWYQWCAYYEEELE